MWRVARPKAQAKFSSQQKLRQHHSSFCLYSNFTTIWQENVRTRRTEAKQITNYNGQLAIFTFQEWLETFKHNQQQKIKTPVGCILERMSNVLCSVKNCISHSQLGKTGEFLKGICCLWGNFVKRRVTKRKFKQIFIWEPKDLTKV